MGSLARSLPPSPPQARISDNRTIGGGTGPTIAAICVDERTSLLVDTLTGRATVVGTGTGGGFHGVYFLRNLDPPLKVEPGVPLGYLGTSTYFTTCAEPAITHLPAGSPSPNRSFMTLYMTLYTL